MNGLNYSSDGCVIGRPEEQTGDRLSWKKSMCSLKTDTNLMYLINQSNVDGQCNM